MNRTRYTTRFPIVTHHGEEILPAGSPLDERALEGLRSRPNDRRMLPLGYSGRVLQDVDDFLDVPPYSTIFRDKKSREDVFSMMQQVKIPYGAVDVAEYFRANDFYTYRHMMVVFAMSTFLVSRLSSVGDFSKSIRASPAHDIGKSSIPLGLLNKPTPLTKAEREHIEHHTLAGYALMHYYSDDESTDIASRVARDHHERLDGSGYPAGVAAIDKVIEIVIASDIYDALISPRPYRNTPFDNRAALEELSSKVLHGKISGETVQALVASNRKSDPNWRDCILSDEQRSVPPKNNNYGILQEA